MEGVHLSTVPPVPSAASRRKALFKVVACFALLGPPVGALTALAFAALALLARGESPAWMASYAMLLPIYGTTLTYMLGLVPALLVGGAVGWWQAFRGPVSGRMATAGGALLGLTAAGVAQVSTLMDGALYVATFAVPSLACWRITRGIGPHRPT